MVTQSIKLGGTASGIAVARVSHGLMSMSWTPQPVPDEVCFEAIKAGIDALPHGVKAFLNTADFYAIDLGTGNLEMLSRFFAKYPEYVDRVFVSVKGGMNVSSHLFPDGSYEFLKKSVDRSVKALGPLKKIDLFEPARIDRKVGIEKTMETLVSLMKEGKFDHIGLSECNADTLRKANSIHPVSVAEIEVSPFEYREEQKKVIATAAELNISVAAYSPLGHGFLTGQIKSPDDLPKDDPRLRLTRFKEEHFRNNMTLVDDIVRIAQKKGITPAQLCIAWVCTTGPTVIPLPGSSKASRTLENLEGGDVVLTEGELEELNEAIGRHEITGDRYFGEGIDVHLWQ
ncbi:hypothetical protein D9758_003749 [Tetrapyrgos nigripes]|uniref:NADP-dependent oxidoreductase domain-containing protein n=1 Tax=Tetrapyrgos nigripes TaxID=182062 RepID=A0A8H5LS80_9AGAR|nr:hypothetical protein D9758_003749 [Tetrapyrgos nigripes]